MPYTPEHKQKTRDAIVISARNLFIKKGYTEVSIDEIMADAGLTRGGFYNHFKNKEDLFKAAIDSFMTCDLFDTLGAPPIDTSLPASDLAHNFVNAYLSKDHLQGADGLCPLIALPTDVARATPAIKASYQKLLEGMLGIFEKAVKPVDGHAVSERALALAATCVGGMVLARAIGDDALSDRIRAAALFVARDALGGKEGAKDEGMEDAGATVAVANGDAAGHAVNANNQPDDDRAPVAAE